MFLPSSCEKTLSRCGCGWSPMSASAAREPPMKPSMSTSPDFMIGGHVTRPEPETKLMAPGGRWRANASTVARWHWPPIVGSFITTVLPMRSAGMSIAYISLSG